MNKTNQPIRFRGKVEIYRDDFLYFSCEAKQIDHGNKKPNPDLEKELRWNAERAFRSWFENKPSWTKPNADTPLVTVTSGGATYQLRIHAV